MIPSPSNYRFLNIGEMIVSSNPKDYISSVLGSCVSVCLHCPSQKVGGIIHYLVPDDKDRRPDQNPLLFGNIAIMALINEMTQIPGVTTERLVAKIVGGSMILSSETRFGVGFHNVNMARTILNHHDIKIVGEHIHGEVSRKLRFYPVSGKLRVYSLKIN